MFPFMQWYFTILYEICAQAVKRIKRHYTSSYRIISLITNPDVISCILIIIDFDRPLFRYYTSNKKNMYFKTFDLFPSFSPTHTKYKKRLGLLNIYILKVEIYNGDIEVHTLVCDDLILFS